MKKGRYLNIALIIFIVLLAGVVGYLTLIGKPVSVEQQPVSSQKNIAQTPKNISPDVLPTKIGQCAQTTVVKVMNRLQDGENGPFIAGSGSAIVYTNNGYQVSYDQVFGIDNSHLGDKIELCLASIPSNCPAGDERGKIYSAKNLRTNESWTLPDAEHMCGGA